MSAALPPATRVAFCQASGHPRPTPVHMMPVVQHARPLTPRTARASDQKFKLIDANGDGVISREERKKAAATHSMTPKPAQTMLVQPRQRQLSQPSRAVHPPMQQLVQPRQSLPVKPVHAVEPVPTQAMQSGLHTLQLDTRIPHEQIAKLEASPPKRSPSLPVKPVHAVEPVPTQAMPSGLHTLQLDTRLPREQIAKLEASPPKRSPSLPVKPVHAVEPVPTQAMQSGLHTLQLDTRIPREQIAKLEASPPSLPPSPNKGRRQSLPVNLVHAVEPVPTQAMPSGLHTLQLDTRFPREQIAKLEASPPKRSPSLPPSPSKGKWQSLPVKPVHAVEPVPTQTMQSGLHTLQLDTRLPHEQIAKCEASPPSLPPSPSKVSPGPQSNDKGSPRVTNPRRGLSRMTKLPNNRVGGLTSDRYEEALNNYSDRCQRVRDQREQDSSLRITSLLRKQRCLTSPETIDEYIKEYIKEVITRGEGSEVGDGETNTLVEPSKFAEFVRSRRSAGSPDMQP